VFSLRDCVETCSLYIQRRKFKPGRSSSLYKRGAFQPEHTVTHPTVPYCCENLRSLTLHTLFQLRSHSTVRNGVSPEDSVPVTWRPESGLHLRHAGRRRGCVVPTGQAVQGKRNASTAARKICFSLLTGGTDVLSVTYAFLDMRLKWITSFTLWLWFPFFSCYFLLFLIPLFRSTPSYSFVPLFVALWFIPFWYSCLVFIYPFTYFFIYLHIYLFTYLLTYLFIYWLIYSPIYVFVYLLICLLIDLLTYLFIWIVCLTS